MKYILITLILAGFSINLSAQINHEKEKHDHERRERMEAMKIGYITDRLELTIQESQQFWPLFNEYAEARKSLRSDFKSRAEKGVTAENADQMLQDIIDYEKADTELKKSYFEKFKAAISAEKIVKLHFMETEFKKDMIRRSRGERGEHKSKQRSWWKD